MKVRFSIDMHDRDGDKFENGIYLHVSESTILRFANLREITDFQIDLTAAMKEIRTAYVDADKPDDEPDPDLEMEEREERKRIAMEMDGPHEEGE